MVNVGGGGGDGKRRQEREVAEERDVAVSVMVGELEREGGDRTPVEAEPPLRDGGERGVVVG